MCPLQPITKEKAEQDLFLFKNRDFSSYLTFGSEGEWLGFLTTEEYLNHPGAHQQKKEPYHGGAMDFDCEPGHQWEISDPMRLEMEKITMKKHFPYFVFGNTKDWRRRWRGVVRPYKNEYKIEMIYPNRFGELGCEARIIRPDITLHHPPHFWNQRLLAWEKGGRNGFDQRTMAVQFVDWSVRWLICFEIWAVTGEWAVQEKKDSLW